MPERFPEGFPAEPQARETIREWDRRAIEEFHMPAVVLMENAGAGAARVIGWLRREEPEAYPEPFQIVCGPGNNGGDGMVVARHLHNHGRAVNILIPGSTRYRPGSEAGVQLEIVTRMKLPLEMLDAAGHLLASLLRERFASGTLVDALFGTGLSRPVSSPMSDWIEAINRSRRSVIALDIPSGLDADTGSILGVAVQARDTITFAATKIGFYRGDGPRLCGRVHGVDIGIPREIFRP